MKITDKNLLHRDYFGRLWSFVCEVRDAEHLEVLRKAYSMHRISSTKYFDCRMVEHHYRQIREKPPKERIETLKHRCNYRMLFIPVEKIKTRKAATKNETKFGALYQRGEHNHLLIQRLKNYYFIIY